jgi:formiminoglutamate deiminase
VTSSVLAVDHAWLGGEDLAPNVRFTISEGRIESIEAADGRGADSIAGIAFPGLVSAHSHAFHRALRGRTHRIGGDFWAWRNPMYELAGRLTPDRYEALAAAVFGEMLRAGITTVGEFHYVHHRPDGTPYEDPNAMQGALLAAADRTGIRITLLDTLYLTADVDGSALAPEQRRFSDGTSAAWSSRVRALAGSVTSERAKVGVAAHSVRAVPGHDLEVVFRLSDELVCPLHIHVSEQPAENEACLAAHQMTPVAWLEDHGLLVSRTTLVHATHTTEADRDLIARSGAGVCLCPTTEADLGDGTGPASEYRALGVPLSLGSDSNAVVDILEEARRVEHHDRLRLRRRGVHSPAALLRSATFEGARALGWDSGRLEPGALADIVVVDPEHLDLSGFDLVNGVATLVMAATRASVTHVLVGGETVLSPGGSSLPDEAAIGGAIERAWR